MSEYLHWANKFIQAQIPELASIPIGYEDLSGVYAKAPDVSLERELAWIAARLELEIPKLRAFRKAAAAVEYLVLNELYEEAIGALKGIDAHLGVSFWSVQLRVLLEQHAGGLERQKRYTSEVRGIYRRGLLSFIAYYTSVRNEERTTLVKYIDDVKSRIDKHQYYEPYVKAYLRYRLVADWPTSLSGFADVLRAEQNHSLIDLYETFIAVCQELIRRDRNEQVWLWLATCLSRVTGIEDFRVGKCLQRTGCSGAVEAFRRRNAVISDPLFEGDVKRAVRAVRAMRKTAEWIDPWQQIYAGFTHSHHMRAELRSLGGPASIYKLLASVVSRGGLAHESFVLISKLLLNLRSLPTAVGLADALRQLVRVSPDDAWRPWLVDLNCPFVGPEGIWDVGQKLVHLPSASGRTEDAWLQFHSRGALKSAFESVANNVLAAASLANDGRYAEALDSLRAWRPGPSVEGLRAWAAMVRLHANFGLNNREEVIGLVSDEGARSEAGKQLLPTVAALQGYQWFDYKLVSRPLAVPVALHLLWSSKESDVTASMLRFAIGQFLKSSGIGRPSRLVDLDGFQMHEVKYFLREVCVPLFLDVSRVLKSTQDVLLERQAVCASLRVIDPDRAANYEAEVASISNQLALAEGQWVVDQTRVHVDVDALVRWAARELSEDYARYRDLQELDLGNVHGFDDVLRALLDSAPSSPIAFEPQGEADALLIDVVQRLRDEFLTNPSFGLDFYLSKRIRHQSFVGLIRGPLEFDHLVTTRESESGRYRKNEFWLSKLSIVQPSSRELVDTAFSRFASRVDEILIAAKDTYLHVRTPDKPAGLFVVDVSPQLLVLSRTIAQWDGTIQDFVVTVISIFWAALENSLNRTRRFISEELKTRLAEAIDELRAAVRKQAGESSASLEFDMSIGKASNAVQRALDDAAGWFTRLGVEVHKQQFRLDQAVKVAIDSALKCHRAFEPSISSRVDGGEQLMLGTVLLFIHDVIFVALGNVRIHSGVEKPKVCISVRPDTVNGTLSVHVESEVRLSLRPAIEKRLAEIRSVIEAKAVGRRTRGEGGSGFLKLAAVVQQSSKGHIDFGFTDEGKFYLKVVYSLVIQRVEFGSLTHEYASCAIS